MIIITKVGWYLHSSNISSEMDKPISSNSVSKIIRSMFADGRWCLLECSQKYRHKRITVDESLAWYVTRMVSCNPPINDKTIRTWVCLTIKDSTVYGINKVQMHNAKSEIRTKKLLNTTDNINQLLVKISDSICVIPTKLEG